MWDRPSAARGSGDLAVGLAGRYGALPTQRLTESCPRREHFSHRASNVNVDLERRLSDESWAYCGGLGDISASIAALSVLVRHTIRFGAIASCWWCVRHPLAKRDTVEFAEVLVWTWVGLIAQRAATRFLSTARRWQAVAVARALRSFEGVCRLVECHGGRRHLAGDDGEQRDQIWLSRRWRGQILGAALADDLVRDFKALPPYARQLVEHCVRSASRRARPSRNAPAGTH